MWRQPSGMGGRAFSRPEGTIAPPPTILIIDDDANMRTIVRRLFTVEGYCVCEAADGVTAFARARQCTPDLIILELGLPGQDGWAVAREVRAEPALDQVPLLVITASGSSAAHRLARRRMPGDYLQTVRAGNRGGSGREPLSTKLRDSEKRNHPRRCRMTKAHVSRRIMMERTNVLKAVFIDTVPHAKEVRGGALWPAPSRNAVRVVNALPNASLAGTAKLSARPCAN